jgi:hypothetical protein
MANKNALCAMLLPYVFSGSASELSPTHIALRSHPVGLINPDGRCSINAVLQVLYLAIATLAQQDTMPAQERQRMLKRTQEKRPDEFARNAILTAQGYGAFDATQGSCALIDLTQWVRSHYFLASQVVATCLVQDLVMGLKNVYGKDKLCYVHIDPTLTNALSWNERFVREIKAQSLDAQDKKAKASTPEFVLVNLEGSHIQQLQDMPLVGDMYNLKRLNSIPSKCTLPHSTTGYKLIGLINFELVGMLPVSQLARYFWVITDKFVGANCAAQHVSAAVRYNDAWFVCDNEHVWSVAPQSCDTAEVAAPPDAVTKALIKSLPGQPLIALYQRSTVDGHEKANGVTAADTAIAGIKMQRIDKSGSGLTPQDIALQLYLFIIFLAIGLLLLVNALVVHHKNPQGLLWKEQLPILVARFGLVFGIIFLFGALRIGTWFIYLYRYHAATERVYLNEKFNPAIRC